MVGLRLKITTISHQFILCQEKGGNFGFEFRIADFALGISFVSFKLSV